MNVSPISISEQKTFDGVDFPLVLAPEAGAEASADTLAQWIASHADELRAQMIDHGAILFRGFGLDSPDDFEAMLDAAQFENMPYIGGAAPRTQVTKSRILTANESPPSEPIPFHHEMAQVPNPPAYVFFYCDIAPSVGGETAIVLSNQVYNRFQAIAPAFAERVEREGVRYIRVMPPQDDATSAIGRSWKSTFQTEDVAEAERRMEAIGTRWEWLESGDLRTETATVPAIRTDERSGKKTFFNSMVAAYTGWIDSRNDPRRAVVCGDGDAVDGDALEATAIAMTEESVAFRWQAGDMLWLDNRLVMHARRPYEGPRRILASIAIG